MDNKMDDVDWSVCLGYEHALTVLSSCNVSCFLFLVLF